MSNGRFTIEKFLSKATGVAIGVVIIKLPLTVLALYFTEYIGLWSQLKLIPPDTFIHHITLSLLVLIVCPG